MAAQRLKNFQRLLGLMGKRSISCMPSSYWRHWAINCFFIFPSSFTYMLSRCWCTGALPWSSLCFSGPVVFPQCGLYLLYMNTWYISSCLVKIKSYGVWLQRGELSRAFFVGFCSLPPKWKQLMTEVQSLFSVWNLN